MPTITTAHRASAQHVIFLVALAACAPVPERVHPVAPVEPGAIAFVDVAVVDPDADSVRRHMTVVVSGGRIASIHPAGTLHLPDGIQRIAGAGRYLMPGLWDAHVHVATSPDSSIGLADRAERLYFPQFVAHGITSVRDLGSDADTVAALRRAVDEGRILGPRIFAASRLLGGRNPWAPAMPHVLLVTSADSARVAVSRIAADGGMFVKAHDMLSREAFFAIAAAARIAGLPLVGHLRPSVPVGEAVAAGQVGVEHVPIELVAACASNDAPAAATRWYDAWIAGGLPAYVDGTAAMWEARQPARCRDVLASLRHAGVHVTPTIVLRLQDSTFAARTGAPLGRTALNEQVCQGDAATSATLDAERHERHARTAFGIVATLHREGVALMAGSDGPQGCLTAGAALHEELRALVQAGLTPREAIRAATITPARFLGVGDVLGSIEVGKYADLVLLAANPLADIDNARAITGVMTRGTWLDDAALRRLRSVQP